KTRLRRRCNPDIGPGLVGWVGCRSIGHCSASPPAQRFGRPELRHPGSDASAEPRAGASRWAGALDLGGSRVQGIATLRSATEVLVEGVVARGIAQAVYQ